MNLRSIVLAAASLVIGLALIALLLTVSNVHVREMFPQWEAMDKAACLWLTALICINALLSSWKWRLTDRAMRQASDAAPSQFESFALTSMGTALGQVLPVQLSMPAARTLGIRIHGRAFQRGTLATFFELAFDAFFGCFLMLASAATFLLHGDEKMWLTITLPAAVLAVLFGGGMLAAARRLLAKLAPERNHASRWRRLVVELSNSALWEPNLGRKLMFLSGLRFTVFVLMAGEVAAAIHADIPLWHFGAAMPFAVLSTAAAITPGGLGLTEFTYAGVLTTLGTPLSVATQFALANRLLVSAGSIMVAALLLPFFFAFRTAAPAVSPEPDYPSETQVES